MKRLRTLAAEWPVSSRYIAVVTTTALLLQIAEVLHTWRT